MATQLKDMKLSDFALKGDSGCDGATFVLCDGDRIMDQCGGELIYVSDNNPWCYNCWTFYGIAKKANSAYEACSACHAYDVGYACYANEAYNACYAYSADNATNASCAYSAYELYVDGSPYCIQSICYACLSSLPGCARILYHT